MTPYSSSKAGLVGLTRAAAIEYAAHWDPRQRDRADGRDDRSRGRPYRASARPDGNAPPPGDADADTRDAQGVRVNCVGPAVIRTPLLAASLNQPVAWLASDEASFVSGSFYAVDGAFTAR